MQRRLTARSAPWEEGKALIPQNPKTKRPQVLSSLCPTLSSYMQLRPEPTSVRL